MTEDDRLLKVVCFSAKRALNTQTPTTLRAYSFAVDKINRLIQLRAHFGEQPSQDDLENISIIETEIDADFLDHFEGQTIIEVVAPSLPLSFLAGGVTYLRQGEVGAICTDE